MIEGFGGVKFQIRQSRSTRCCSDGPGKSLPEELEGCLAAKFLGLGFLKR